jgi:hypothetical protein
MSRWFRLDDDIINDPKILLLPEAMRWIWIAFLCIASKNNGALPSIEIVALSLRVKTTKAAEYITLLVSAGLIDKTETGFAPHNWNARQYKSDVSTERVKRFRKQDRNVSETPPDTETEPQRKEDTAGAVSSRVYAFESGVIRLNQRDFDQWTQAFSFLELPAELLSLSKWAESEGPNWFHAVKGALAKRNREVKAKAAREETNTEFKWNGKIEGVI